MNRAIIAIYFLFSITAIFHNDAFGQEFVAPVNYNPFLTNKATSINKLAKKTSTTPLTLPFFEDFTSYGVYPDTTKWVDYEVYINNTMCVSPVSRGCATFDALNSNGMPYDSFSNATFHYADSLTSQPIDMSANTAADSVYLSFFYQPQGNGFYPLAEDSLILFLKDVYGGFVQVWSVPGPGMLQPFQQVMIPIVDSIYFHNSFQFRFVNKAALYWADAIWNVDYIRLDKSRSAGDTAIADIAIATNPSFLLNDYSFMPYNQFMVNPSGEMAAEVSDSIKNNYSSSQTVNCSMVLTDQGSGSALFTGGALPVTMPGYQAKQAMEAFAITPSGLPTYPVNTKVVFEEKLYLQSTASTGPAVNDTIVQNQVFDNYLAYDDGSAEKSYYLNLFPTLDGRIAIEYHLNRQDTMRGLAIYFGRQIPYPIYKTFNIFVYSALAGVNGAPADVTVDSQEFYIPFYADTQNHFWNYIFDQPLVLPAGTFYAGTQQPAASGDDSLYFGLDVNRVGANHAYFRVLNVWEPSLISGAIMMRPLLGRYVQPSAISDVNVSRSQWKVMPNPAKDMLQFEFESEREANYRITDIQGKTVLQGTTFNEHTIDISHLIPGLYFVNLVCDGVAGAPQKFVKL